MIVSHCATLKILWAILHFTLLKLIQSDKYELLLYFILKLVLSFRLRVIEFQPHFFAVSSSSESEKSSTGFLHIFHYYYVWVESRIEHMFGFLHVIIVQVLQSLVGCSINEKYH